MNALVMYDHQTDTLWSQFLSKGVEGPLKDEQLSAIPATQTSWQAWRELHPDTTVLDKGGAYQQDSYVHYYENGQSGIHGQFNPDDRLYAKELIVGVNLDGNAKAYPFSALSREQVVNDTLTNEEVLIFFDASTGTALAFDRKPGDSPLTFRVEGEPAGARTILVDEETGSRWMAFTGSAIDGELKGSRLERIPSHLSFWFAWSDWNPQTEIWESTSFPTEG